MGPALDLQRVANQLRGDVLRMVHTAQAGHVAGPLSAGEIYSVLYFGGVVDLAQDKIVLSCGHYCPIMYAALARNGNFPRSELKTFMQAGSRLPGHPERGSLPEVEVSAGPLGQGISVAVGMALALKIQYGQRSQKTTPRVYCVLSDGEIQEGQVWEAFNTAVRRQLDNLIFILDRNRIQIENYVAQVATYGEVAGRLEAFGLHVLEIEGNRTDKIMEAITQAKEVMGGPVMIVANTVGGKGVSFMENDPSWHDKVPSQDELTKALKELGEKNEQV
ncbi:TPA: transketolase [Candidatus Collierbacteria bacterium]|nr:transketolase [Candidatus Collierbacteria bacterium]